MAAMLSSKNGFNLYPFHNMTDPNNLRAHYRATSQKLARSRQIREGITWLSLWLSAGLAAAFALL